jgi:hypothetical protein
LNRAARGEEGFLLPCLKGAPRGEKGAPWEAPSRGKKGEGRHGWELDGHGRSLRTQRNRGKKRWGGGGNGGRRGVVPWRPCSCALERRKGGDAMDREGAPCALPCALAAVAVEQGGRRAVAARKN